MRVEDLRSGDLVYWKGKGFLPWLVRFWTRPKFWSLKLAPFYHVGMVWRNGGTIFYTDASPQGVAVFSFAVNTPSHAQRTHSAWDDATTVAMKSMLGKPYSFWTAALTPFKLAGRGSSAFMCSEYVTRLMERMGWDWRGYQPTPEGVRLGVLAATGNDAEVIE